MKKIAIIICCQFIACIIQAQDKLPAFNKIDKADLLMQDCDFDPGAEAMVLINFGDIEISYAENIGWVSESNYRVRIKILKAKAVDWAQVKLRFRSRDKLEEIFNVRGISFNLDEKGDIEESVLEKKSIYEKAIDKEFTEISFALPNIKTGSVFEYRYKMIRRSYRYIPSWNFQKSIPVRYSAYNVIVPEYFQFTAQTTLRQQMERESKTSGEQTKGNWYKMHNIPGIKKEPYSSGIKDYVQRIEFQLSTINAPNYFENILTTWPKIIEELLGAEVFGKAFKKNIKSTADLDMLLITQPAAKDRIRNTYNYVQQNMQWNGEYDIAVYDGGIKSAWDKKNGTIAEINFILLNFLRKAGIKAKPLLISTKDNGTINTYHPFINQFNGVMVYVKDGNDEYILNAADKYNPFNVVPYDVALTYALVVDNENGGIVELNSDGKFVNNIFFTCSIEADGKLSGQATLKSSGYAKNLRMETKTKKRLTEIFEDNTGINIKADSVNMMNESDELLPLEEKTTFSGYIQTSGEYLFLPCNLFMGLGKNVFIDEKRVMDIDFSYPKSYSVTGNYFLPDDFTVNALPKNTKLIMPDTSIVLTRVMQQEGSMITFRIGLDIKVFGYAADAYPYVKEFYKKLYAILDERIVLTKK